MRYQVDHQRRSRLSRNRYLRFWSLVMNHPQIRPGYCKSFVSLRNFCHLVKVDQKEFLTLAATSQELYRYGAIRTGSKTRDLNLPSKELKSVQRALVRRLFRNVDWPSYLHGAIKGRSAKTNADVHAGAATIVKVDIKDFFPSITPTHVFRAWRTLGFSTKISRYLTRLTTYEGALPQGSPTSAPIANLVLGPEEAELVSQIESTGHRYTRYIDDITISGPNPRMHLQEAIRVVQRSGFVISRHKTKIEPRHTHQEVTGYTTNNGIPTISKPYRELVRSRILALSQLSGDVRLREVRSIVGCINYIASTNQTASAKLTDLLTISVTQQEIVLAHKVKPFAGA